MTKMIHRPLYLGIIFIALIVSGNGVVAKKSGGGGKSTSSGGSYGTSTSSTYRGSSYRGSSAGSNNASDDETNKSTFIVVTVVVASTVMGIVVFLFRHKILALFGIETGGYHQKLEQAKKRVVLRQGAGEESPPQNGEYEAPYVTRVDIQENVKEVIRPTMKIQLTFHRLTTGENGWEITGRGTIKGGPGNPFTIKEGKLAPTGEAYWIHEGENEDDECFSAGTFLPHTNKFYGSFTCKKDAHTTTYTSFSLLDEEIQMSAVATEEEEEDNGVVKP